MTSIDLQLTGKDAAYLNEQATLRGYKDVQSFVQYLIETDQRRQLRQEVEAMLIETVNGPFTPWSREDLDGIRASGLNIIDHLRVRHGAQ